MFFLIYYLNLQNVNLSRIKKIAKLVPNQRQLLFYQLLNFLWKFLADKNATFIIQQRWAQAKNNS